MSCSSVSHPSPNEDISLSESLASMSLSSEADNGDDVEEFDSDASQHSLTPITSTTASTDSNSPANSHRSHSRDPSFDGDDGSDSSAATTPSNASANAGAANGTASSQCGGQRGVNEKRPSQYDNRRNLHVDNLPPMTEVEFRNLFLAFGPIARSRIVTDAITGLPAGYGFVMFENECDAVVALQSLHNTYLPNSTKPLRVTVKKPKTAKAWEREREKELEKQKLLAHGPVNIQTIFVNTNLYVAGLPANWTKREMDEIFSQFGMILESRILLEKHSHVSKGVGFVRFQQLECCHQAIQALNGKPAPVPASLKANGKGNASAANPNGNREESKQNLTVRFAVDKTAQALAVAQQTVMGTLNQQRNNAAQTNSAQHSHSRAEMSANANNQKYFAVLNSGALSQSTPRSNSPTAQTTPINVHPAVSGAAYGAPMNAQQIQSYLAMQQHQLARVAALATVSGSNRPSFSASNAPSPSTFAFPTPSQSAADLSAYSLENALLLSQLNTPLSSSALSLNSLAAAAALTPMNLSSFALTPASSSAAALNQFYTGNSLSTLTPFANQVFV